MPRTKTTLPAPSRQKGQRSLDEPLYLIRPFFQNWTSPTWVTSEVWRTVVLSQQVCLICRETLIGNILSLDWKVEPRDSTQRDELKRDIDYYTKFLEYSGDFDWSEIVEWVTSDLLDLPFGSGVEIGREGDNSEGKVLWIELLDGGTLYPTLNRDWPVAQYVPESGITPVVFPSHAINRVYMSPRTEIRRKGWGMAPPEKIWIALNLLSTGDNYYARLLMDTPDAGILDLIDMEKESAREWVEGWRQLLSGVDPQKIPVLYEHNTPAHWIPFTRNPSDIQFDNAIGRYTAIVSAGYGLTPSDIGLSSGGQNGGNTMAGNLREERRSKRNGYARLKRKLESFMTRLLPDTLRFRFIDMDDELMVSLGRARLANATAWTAMVAGNMFTEEEARNQTIADGMLSISVPESLPPEIVKKLKVKEEMSARLLEPKDKNDEKTAERPSMLGRPNSPSSGGWGETAARSWIDLLVSTDDKHFQRLAYLAYPNVLADAVGMYNSLEDHSQLDNFIGRHDLALWTGEGLSELPELSQVSIATTKDMIVAELASTPWWSSVVDAAMDFLRVVYHTTLDQSIREAQLRSYVEQRASVLPEIDAEKLIGRQYDHLSSHIPSLIANSVIAGVRDFVLESEITGDRGLDVYNPRLLQAIRSHLNTALFALSDVIEQNTSGIIIEEFVKCTLNHE
jgi:hypothetical protein